MKLNSDFIKNFLDYSMNKDNWTRRWTILQFNTFRFNNTMFCAVIFFRLLKKYQPNGYFFNENKNVRRF